MVPRLKNKSNKLTMSFFSHLDNKHAVSLVSQLETSGALTSKQTNGDATMTSQERHLEMNAIDTLVMYRQICTLLLSCSRQDLHISHALQQNGVVLERILQLFDISCSTLGKDIPFKRIFTWSELTISNNEDCSD